MKNIALPVLLLILIASGACFAASSSVETGVGVIIGSAKSLVVQGSNYMVHRYLGIPYAKPPVDELRFRVPESADPFETPFNATQFGASCLQAASHFSPLPEGDISEDCLSLNIYVPDLAADNDTGHAVMVWVHGGGFSAGDGQLYNGDTLAAFGNVIVVTINYRLGIWGFLGTNDDVSPGNYGLWDQHLAFRWVHDNIAAFGGDINRVTIFGESAGAISVSIQAFYPLNKGLFRRVIAESGSPMRSTVYSLDPLGSAKSVAKKLGCEISSSSALVSCLRQTNSDTLLSTIAAMSLNPEEAASLNFQPCVDNKFIKTPYYNIKTSTDTLKGNIEHFRSIDLMNGANYQEGALMFVVAGIPQNAMDAFQVTREQMNSVHIPTAIYTAYGTATTPVTSKLVQAEYTDWEGPNDPNLLKHQYVKLFSDTVFVTATMAQSLVHVAAGTEVNSFVYQFKPAPSRSFFPVPNWIKGANHADELTFVFGFDDVMYAALGAENPALDWEYELAYTVMTYWTNFAKSGDPNQPESVVTVWPKYNMEEQKGIVLDKNMTVDSAIKNFINAKEVNFWSDVLPTVMEAIADVEDSTTKKNDKTSSSVVIKTSLYNFMLVVGVIMHVYTSLTFSV